jgi:Yip1 domain
VSEPTLTPGVPSASLWEDFIDIFTSPSAVFRRREHSGFGLQLLVLTVIFAILVLGTKSLLLPAIDADIARQSAKMLHSNPGMTAEQVEKGRAMGEMIGPIAVIVLLPLMVVLTGLALWMVGKIFDSSQTATQGMMIATYAFFPKLLYSIASAIIAFLSNPDRLNGMSRVTVGLGAFLDPDKTSPVLMALLVRVDVFTLWATVLLAIGLQITGKLSKSNSYLAAAIVWCIGALPGVLGALRS